MTGSPASAKGSRKNFILYVTALLAVLCFDLYKIRIGMYHDEPIHVDYAKLFLSGQRPLTQVWDFLQMPGLLAAPFTAAFYAVTGSVEGVIYFHRLLFLVLHFLCAVFVYRTLRLILSELQAQIVSVFSAIYVWHFMIICYKSMLYWGVIVTLMCFIRYLHDGKTLHLVLADLAFCAAILSFPTAILLVIPLSLFLYRTSGDPKGSVRIFLGGCALIGAITVIFILATLPGGSIRTLFEVYLKAAEKSDHGTLYKMMRRFMEIGGMWISANLIALAYDKITLLREKTKDVYLFLSLVFWGAIAGVMILRMHKLSTSLFWVAFCGFYFVAEALVRRGYLVTEKEEIVRPLMFTLSVWLLLVITLATNTGIAVIAFGAVLGMMGILIAVTGKAASCASARLLFVSIMAAHAFTFAFFVLEYDLPFRENENRTHHILQERTYVTEGPGKGLLFNEDTLSEYYNALHAVRTHVRPEDRVFIMSEHYRRYVGALSTEAEEVVHSELEYETDSPLPGIWCDAFPERMPSVVLIDGEFVGDVMTWLNETPPGRYISSRYDIAGAVWHGNWLVLRR